MMGKRGAPAGNQNARKHGFYSKVLTETEKLEMKEAEGIEGLDDELALLRVKLCRLLDNHPDRIDLHMQAVNMIARLVRTRHGLSPKDIKNLKDAVADVIREIAIPLGAKFVP